MKNVLIPITDKKITIADLKNTVDRYRNEALNVVLLYVSRCKERPAELMISALKDTFEDDALEVLMPLKKGLLKEYSYLPEFTIITDSCYRNKYDAIVEAVETYQIDIVAITEEKKAGLRKALGLNEKSKIINKLPSDAQVVLV
ncbi:hypothetical protein MQE36_00830 [Zhouia spongiae]|uniref:Universal stress protein n=1 Tax=Zhouia spongiae TaxID=2202721 RepID=A0ABY3YM94_9FLAO|nr:hypothetical protein [Zhouia spongiae]UNY98915.1 hypothetical protein MQE36_00830 [Zhouia spongiae]